MVWTDVGITSSTFGVGNVSFTARDANGVLIGTNPGFNLGNGSAVPSSAEDRFFGIVHPGGISSISISMPNSGDWENNSSAIRPFELRRFQRFHLGDQSRWHWRKIYHGRRASPRLAQWSMDGLPARRRNVHQPTQSLGEKSLDRSGIALLHEQRFHHQFRLERKHGINFRQQLCFPEPRIGWAGDATSDCPHAAMFQWRAVVNPVDGSLAFHNFSANANAGVYIAPPDFSSRTKFNRAIHAPPALAGLVI